MSKWVLDGKQINLMRYLAVCAFDMSMETRMISKRIPFAVIGATLAVMQRVRYRQIHS